MRESEDHDPHCDGTGWYDQVRVCWLECHSSLIDVMLLRWFVVRVGVRLRSYISLLLLEYWVLMGLGRERWSWRCRWHTNHDASETEFGFGSRVWAFRCLMHSF